MIGVDTSVHRSLSLGTPPEQAKRAADLIDDDNTSIGMSIVALAECAHVLRTQYGVGQRDIIDSLIDLVQRENIRIVDARADVLVGMLVRARSMPGRPIPDAMIVAALASAERHPDRDLRRGPAALRGRIRTP